MGNLMAWLQREWKDHRPELVVREAPFPLEAFKRTRNSQEGVEMAYGLHGVLEGICDRYGVRLEKVYAATVRKHFIGRAHAKGRDRTKDMVVNRCWVLGLMPREVYDTDRADALAVFDWAAATYGQRAADKLYLFGEKAKA